MLTRLLCMESRSTGGDLDSEPVLLVRSLQHLECSITAICGFLQSRRRTLGSLGVRSVCALAQPPGGAIFSGSDTRSVYGGVSTSRSAPYHQTLGAAWLSRPQSQRTAQRSGRSTSRF